MIRKGIALIVILLFVGVSIASSTVGNVVVEKSVTTTTKSYGNPPWSMFCHDTHHTGRSQYSTADNPFEEKWWFKTTHTEDGYYEGCFINIAEDGTIYFTDIRCIYALYPNGTLKWKFDEFEHYDEIESHPAVDNNGTIYALASSGRLYTIYPNGTLKWCCKFPAWIYSDPMISDDGIIYFGTTHGYIYAVYPNGTIKWKYKVYSGCYHASPAIAVDGTIYIGSGVHLYAIYPNATLRWKIELQDNYWIPNPPSIADDGTVYVITYQTDYPVYLFALNPNDGSIKWKYKLGVSSYFKINPCLGDDGTIYILRDETLHAINPDGTKKWERKLGSNYYDPIDSEIPAISADGTIYVTFWGHWYEMGGGGYDNYLYAFNPNGKELWHTLFDKPYYQIESSPVIGEDGTFYLGLTHCRKVTQYDYEYTSYLHVFNNRDPNAPSTPEINGPIEGVTEVQYNYTIVSSDPNGDDIYYYINWGIPSYYASFLGFFPSDLVEIGPISSGEEITINHIWEGQGKYTIRVRAKDSNNLVSPWSELEVTMPNSKNIFLQGWLNRFPILHKILDVLRVKIT